MNLAQREMLSHVLQQLDYPILSRHAMTSDDYLCQSYANLAKLQSEAKNRFDLLISLISHKLIDLGNSNDRLQVV